MRNENTLRILDCVYLVHGQTVREARSQRGCRGVSRGGGKKKREDNKGMITRSRRARKFVQPVTADLTVTGVTL